MIHTIIITTTSVWRLLFNEYKTRRTFALFYLYPLRNYFYQVSNICWWNGPDARNLRYVHLKAAQNFLSSSHTRMEYLHEQNGKWNDCTYRTQLKDMLVSWKTLCAHATSSLTCYLYSTTHLQLCWCWLLAISPKRVNRIPLTLALKLQSIRI